jgi:hypothetical protein
VPAIFRHAVSRAAKVSLSALVRVPKNLIAAKLADCPDVTRSKIPSPVGSVVVGFGATIVARLPRFAVKSLVNASVAV